MATLAKPKRSKETWSKLQSLAPPATTLEGEEHERFVRKTVDAWINDRRFSVKNLGSLMEILSITRREVAVVRHRVLTVRRRSRVQTEPDHGREWRREPEPESLFHLPFRPPPGFEKDEEEEFESLGHRQVRSCPECKGNRTVTCGKCKGRGQVDCPSCDGKGQKERTRKEGGRRRIELEDCRRCNGMRRVDCKKCNTRGERECKECDGYGKLVDKVLVGTRYRPDEITDVLYRGDLPAEELAEDDVKGHRIITAMVRELEHDRKGEPAPDLAHFSKLNSAKAFEPYLEHIREVADSDEEDERIFRHEVDLLLVPVTEVAYRYHQKDYKLFLFGKQDRVHADPRPSATAAFLGSAFRSLAGLFGRRKKPADQPAAAILEACIWMCWADGKVQDSERELLFGFIRMFSLPKRETARLGRLVEEKPEGFHFDGRLELAADKRRCLKLCWQLTLADGVVQRSEKEVFAQMAEQLGIGGKVLAAIQKQAEKEMDQEAAKTMM